MKKQVIFVISLFLMIFMIGIVSAQWTQNLDEGLVAYYNFEETSGTVVHDVSMGGLYDGTIVGEGGIWKSGISENGLDFTPDTYVDINYADFQDLFNGTSDFTISGWNKYDFDNVTYQFIDISYASELQAYVAKDNKFYVDGPGWVASSNPTLRQANIWYHWIIAHDAGTNNITSYINGIVDASFIWGVGAKPTKAITIGARGDHITYFMDGIIDELGIWDRTLTPEEIVQLYNNGNGLSYYIEDADEDGISDYYDNCLLIPNPNQFDDDLDEIGNACDNCVYHYNPSQLDTNEDGIGDACESAIDESLIERIEDLEQQVGDLTIELETQKGLIDSIQEALDNFIDKIISYFTSLPEGQREDILCNRLKETGETSIDELGLYCEIVQGKKDKCVCGEEVPR